MSSQASANAMESVRQLSGATKLNVAGLVIAAVGMILQIGAGSTLYPSFTGPVVLIVSAALVTLRPGRWTSYVGLVVPLVLGIGAVTAAVMTGVFVDQLTDVGRPGIFVGSLLHVIGLVAAVAGGARVVRARRGAAALDR